MGSKVEYIKRKLLLSKRDTLEVEPDFTDTGVYFHPLPKDARTMFSEGETIRGRFGTAYDTGNKDKRGVTIYKQYFVPEELDKRNRGKNK